jgi:hypothetical protein
VFGAMAVLTVVISAPVLYFMMQSEEDPQQSKTPTERSRLSFRDKSPIYEGGILLGIGFLPAAFLYMDFGILDHFELVKLSLMVGLLPGGLLVWGLYTYFDQFKQNQHGWVHGMILGTVGVAFLMYSLIGYANIFVGSQTKRTVETKALDKKEYSWNSRGSRAGPVHFYYLTVPLKTTDGQITQHDISVHGSELVRTKLETTPIRLELHTGAFGVRWVDDVRVGDSKY